MMIIEIIGIDITSNSRNRLGVSIDVQGVLKLAVFPPMGSFIKV
jgi:hypothetical protein